MTVAQWVKYDGSEEQIAEMHRSIFDNGYSFKYVDGFTTVPLRDIIEIDGDFNPEFQPTHYLICDPHPYADMICQWARTGQPVWVRKLFECGIEKEWQMFVTTTPDWNIPNVEYSFTEFKEEV